MPRINRTYNSPGAYGAAAQGGYGYNPYSYGSAVLPPNWLSGMSAGPVGRPQSGLFSPLPFQGDLGRGMVDLDALIAQLRSEGPPEGVLQAVRSAATQDTAKRGLEGPLASSVVSQAQGDVISQHDQYRRGALAQLLMQRQGMVRELQGDEARRRGAIAEAARQQYESDARFRQMLFQLLGLGVGAGLAPFTGGASLAIAPAAGMGLGGILEHAGVFGRGEPYYGGGYSPY